MQEEPKLVDRISPELKLQASSRVGTVDDRFWRKVVRLPNSECWHWIGGTNEHGYGVFWFRGRLHKAHRVSWIFEYGEIPDGLDVLHQCDNPPCIRPSHLFVGTAKTNAQDAARKHRMPYGEGHWGAKLTTEDVVEIRKQHVKWTKNHRQLAERYGVSVINIQHVLYRRSWKHI